MWVFLGTAHGKIKDCYIGINKLLGGAGQWNTFSGSVCGDVSCFIFKEMEKKRLGIIITSKSNHKEAQRAVIEFVDDIDFCSSGLESDQKM